jgi:hypothetical protein
MSERLVLRAPSEKLSKAQRLEQKLDSIYYTIPHTELLSEPGIEFPIFHSAKTLLIILP